MLIIAMPKSASTSLLATLRQHHKYSGMQLFFKEKPIPDDFKILGRLHSDVRILSEASLRKFCEPDSFYKQHLVPTSKNLTFLYDKPKVILLRPFEEIIPAYRRNYLLRAIWVNRILPPYSHAESGRLFKVCNSEEEWIERAKRIGLMKELQKFYEGWNNHSGDKLVIQYSDLISNPKLCVNLIEKYFGLQGSVK